MAAIADRIERRLTAILVADMVGFSAQMEAHEDATLVSLRRWRRELIDPTLERHKGRLIKTTGDGMLVEFASVVDAVAFAADVQRAVAKHNAESDAPEMLFRIGINLGDVVIEEGDVYGDGVNVAARLEPLAEPGGILVSAAVREQVGDRIDVVFVDAGERTLKNISRPIRTYRVVTGAERPRTSQKAPSAGDGKPSIAVLPLVNMSADPNDEFFADGLTEDILTGLSRFKDLFVISRTSSFVYKGRSVTVQEVASDLGVRFVLEGSVRKAGGRVRVTVQLIDAVADQHVWAERYDGDVEDIFEMQDKMTSAIVATLPGRIEAFAQSGVERGHPDDMAAYQLMQAGRRLHHNSNYDDNARALEFLARAVEMDPQSASAHAWRACTLGQAWVHGWVEDRDATWELTSAELEKARKLDDNDSDVLRLLAAVAVIQNDIESAQRHQEKALQLNPNDDLIVVQQGEVLTWLGRGEEGVAWVKKAMALNPYHPERFWGHLGRAHFVARQYDEAVACFRRLSVADKVVHACLAAAMGAAGDVAGAQRHGAEVLRLDPAFTVNGYLATLHYMRSEDVAHHRAALLAAGLPEA